jgi:AcrR family transcriptional regulator
MPRTVAQFEEIREQKIALIMQTSLDLFANEGFYPTSISKIAQKARISKGLLYNYFKSKDALILAIIGKGINQLTEHLDPDHDGFLTESEFEFFINENFRILQANVDYWKLYFSVRMQPAVFKLVKQKYPHFLPALHQVLFGYFQRKGVNDPELEATYFDAMLDGICLNYIMDPDGFPLEKVRTLILERFK